MRFLYLSLFILMTGRLWAQPANDNCINATVLTEVENWCSETASLNNLNGTDEGIPTAGCFPTNQPPADVWFAFTAIGNTLSVGVTGDFNDPNIDWGTLQNPSIAIYSGNCDNLQELTCGSDGAGLHVINTETTNLLIGTTYYIRISGEDGRMGTFSLCVNNYNSVPDPSGDCNPGVILCDKSSFAVEKITGSGNNPSELQGIFCNATQAILEDASTWYKWTCDVAGSLSFTLTPQNPADDLDFWVFELPAGIEDCNNKVLIRNMASGRNNNAPFNEWEPCTGATGLSLTDTDVSEDCGCQVGDNNFLAALDMEAGRSYALIISNFSNSGSGFSIEFGGTGTFLGPKADFTVEPPTTCVGESLTFTDASTYIGDLVDWQWNFGEGATPATASGQTPPAVSYTTPGVKSVLLSVETDRGCIVSQVAQVVITCCDDTFTIDGDITGPSCPDGDNGSIDLTATSPFPPYNYSWSNGTTEEDPFGLTEGEYMVTVTDLFNCMGTASFTVESPGALEIDTLITQPTCNGGTDGAISLQISGGSPPYEFDWNNTGFTSENSLSNISQGDYPVTIRDQNGCLTDLVIPVRELQLVLDPTIQAIVPPSCTGLSNGSITISIDNGLAPYEYNWNDGSGFVDESSLSGLPAGSYIVDVLDANLCMGQFEFILLDPEPLALTFDFNDISCNGADDGLVTAIVSGGTPPYSYSWGNGATTATIQDLAAGEYSVEVLDANGCDIDAVIALIEPQVLGIEIAEIIDNVCFGESNGSVVAASIGGTGPFEYSVDGGPFQPSPTLSGLPAGTFMIAVRDAGNCVASIEATVNEPPQLTVDAGPDQTVDLGFDTRIRATPSDPFVTYEWMPMDSFNCVNTECSWIQVAPPDNTVYTVVVTDANGCQASDDVLISLSKKRPIYIPNAISPNNDGRNDSFIAYGGPAADIIESLKIFDRWGDLIFERENLSLNNLGDGWDGTFDGKLVNTGVFVYVIDIRFIDGIVETFSGDVTVTR